MFECRVAWDAYDIVWIAVSLLVYIHRVRFTLIDYWKLNPLIKQIHVGPLLHIIDVYIVKIFIKINFFFAKMTSFGNTERIV